MIPLSRHFLPYALEPNPDGSWVVLNRRYKPCGVTASGWVEYDDPRHSVRLPGLTRKRAAALDIDGGRDGDWPRRFWLFNDETAPWRSDAAMAAYLARLTALMRLRARDK